MGQPSSHAAKTTRGQRASRDEVINLAKRGAVRLASLGIRSKPSDIIESINLKLICFAA